VSRLVLVRHGRAAAGWDADLDPGLDDVGHRQAAAVAEALHPLGPLPIVVSPLRRTRETAAPLEARWGVEAVVEPLVGEIVGPTDDLAARGAWLREAMAGTWSDLGPAYQAWRDDVVSCLLDLRADTVVVSHFIAINAAVGRATGDDRVVCFVPENCSRTVLESDGRTLTVLDLGDEAAQTVVR
jgi:broad specificity phosphatase PhoE